LWGFWDKDLLKSKKEIYFNEKLTKNWRVFLHCYNQIKAFDIAVFQIKENGNIHALGVVKRTCYNDQTPIFPKELKDGNVLFPWRVQFSIVLFSKEAFLERHFLSLENYIDGYGIGELPEHDFMEILKHVIKKSNLIIRISME
jgi:hypothetical protein